MILNKNYLINLVFILSFFPFIKVFPFITAEVQPIAALFAFIYLFKYGRSINRYILLYFLMILLYFTIAVFKYLLFNATGELLIASILESTIIFITPLFIYLALFNNLDLVSVNAFRFIQYSWFTISLLQAYFPSLLSITGVNFILSSIISRFSSEAIGGARGVSAFAPEPSYAAQVIIVIILFSFFMYRKNKIQKNELYYMLFTDVIMLSTNRSATFAAFLIVLLISYLFAYFTISFRTLFQAKVSIIKKRNIFTTWVIILCFSISIFILPQLTANLFSGSRTGDLFDSISAINYDNLGFFDFLDITNQLGSQRSISVYVGYFNAIDTYGLGSGLGSWANNFVDSLEKSGLRTDRIGFFVDNGINNLKPYSYAALLAFDTGFFGLISLSMIFILSFFTRLNYQVSQYAWSCLFLALFMLYFNSVASLPCGWITFLLFLEDRQLSKLKN